MQPLKSYNNSHTTWTFLEFPSQPKTQLHITMTLTSSEGTLIQALWAKIAPQANTLGAEALERLFLSFPQTKTYFPHFDLSHGSADLLNQGGKILNALGNAAGHLGDLNNNLSTLSDLHAYNLRVDPGNFELLSHTIQVVLAVHFPDDFTAEAQSAWDKFLSEVSTVLTSKYR
ncbi:hemoglobin subunit alpha-3-like [Hyla sarda]|uniref:hemoglobin subunit alpha-3-like n=1 Tax=Hyla sarda TaxID=327740 RepID=UPI0024C2EEEF|nr:hemoglobin subunit alpha-3-like [Hyla sarda]